MAGALGGAGANRAAGAWRALDSPVAGDRRLLGCPRRWLRRPAAPKKIADARLLVEIKAAMVRGRGAYGSPRVLRELRAHGVRVGKTRIERLMRQNGLQARQKRRFVHTTDSRHERSIAANLLDRDFDPTAANTGGLAT